MSHFNTAQARGADVVRSSENGQMQFFVQGPRAANGISIARWRHTEGTVLMQDMLESVLIYKISGNIEVDRIIDDEVLTKRTINRSCSFTPSHQPTRWNMRGGNSDVLHIYLNTEAMRRHVDSNFGPNVPVDMSSFYGIQDPWLSAFCEMLLAEYNSIVDGEEVDSLLLSEAEHMLTRRLLKMQQKSAAARLLEDRQTVTPLRPFLLRRVSEHLEASSNQKVRVQDLAELCRMSEDYFLRAYKAATGQTPYRAALVNRLQKAAGYLSGTDEVMSSIAMKTGFRSQSHFSAQFKSHFGMSPTEYRLSS